MNGLSSSRKWIPLVCILCAATLFLAACGGSYGGGNYYDSAAPEAADYDRDDGYYPEAEVDYYDGPLPEEVAEPGDAVSDGGTATSIERKIDRDISLDLQSKEFDEALAQLDTLIKEAGGYVEASNISNHSLYYSSSVEQTYRSANITYRIPADRLDEVLERIPEICHVYNQSETTRDLTESYIDISARLESAKATEARLLELMSQATTMEDIITIEEKLAEVRYEIESYTSQLTGIDRQTRYSHLYIYLNEVIDYQVVTTPKNFGDQVGAAFISSINAILEFGQWIILSLVTVLPFILVYGGLVAIVVFIILKISKKIAAKRPKKQPAAVYMNQVPPPPGHALNRQPPQPQTPSQDQDEDKKE